MSPVALVILVAGIALALFVLSRRGGRSPSSGAALPHPPVQPDDVEGLVRAGRKIDAIKAFRARHRVGLKEAKDAVDALDCQLRR